MNKRKKYFITGATGSFGQNFIKKIIKNPNTKKVVIFSRDELKQYELSKNLKKYQKKTRFLIGDVRNRTRIEEAIADCNIVVHAAALKQVDTCENNPEEAINTNVYGSINVIKAALKKNVEKCILISTDKAVNPINLYGSTKLTAEKMFISSNLTSGGKKTKFSVIRYGNVSFSRGSVLVLYKELINKKLKQLPLTDPEMTRFCISLDKAVTFVDNCIDKMKGNEIFIPKSKSYRVIDIIKAANKTPKIIGIRGGEKVHETLISKEEMPKIKEYNDHFVLNNKLKNNNRKYKNGYVSNLKGNFMTLNEINNILNSRV